MRRGFAAMVKGMGRLQSQQENADEPGPESDVTVYVHVSLDTWFPEWFPVFIQEFHLFA
jgi:hypothetical protein